MSRHRRAVEVVEQHGTGPVGPSLLTPQEFARFHAISHVRSPEPEDGLWLLQLVGEVERRQPARDVASYERGRVDERLYWRAKETLPVRLVALPSWVGWAAVAVLVLLAVALALQARP